MMQSAVADRRRSRDRGRHHRRRAAPSRRELAVIFCERNERFRADLRADVVAGMNDGSLRSTVDLGASRWRPSSSRVINRMQDERAGFMISSSSE